MPWVDFDGDLVGVFFSEARLRRVMPLITQLQGAVREAMSVGGSAREGAQGEASGSGGPGVGASRREAVTSGAADSRSDPSAVFMRMSHGRPTVDREEFRDFVDGLPIGERLEQRPGGVDRLFNRLDANDDGQLTLEEYERIQELRRLRNR
jgi:hypothetical protein